MALFEHFPYTDFHNTNLDELIRYSKEAKENAASAVTTSDEAKEIVLENQEDVKQFHVDATQALADIQTAGTNAVNSVGSAETRAKKAVSEKGAEVIASIPEDYSELSAQVEANTETTGVVRESLQPITFMRSMTFMYQGTKDITYTREEMEAKIDECLEIGITTFDFAAHITAPYEKRDLFESGDLSFAELNTMVRCYPDFSDINHVLAYVKSHGGTVKNLGFYSNWLRDMFTSGKMTVHESWKAYQYGLEEVMPALDKNYLPQYFGIFNEYPAEMFADHEIEGDPYKGIKAEILATISYVKGNKEAQEHKGQGALTYHKGVGISGCRTTNAKYLLQCNAYFIHPYIQPFGYFGRYTPDYILKEVAEMHAEIAKADWAREFVRSNGGKLELIAEEFGVMPYWEAIRTPGTWKDYSEYTKTGAVQEKYLRIIAPILREHGITCAGWWWELYEEGKDLYGRLARKEVVL